jgi:tetratricopeptide (TPR) repeat protein
MAAPGRRRGSHGVCSRTGRLVRPAGYRIPARSGPAGSRAGAGPASHLVDKNLVVYEEDERGQGRYRLLETVRQYAGDRLMESGGGEARRTRHRDHFLALAEEAEPKLRGPEQGRWLNTLESEHDNLRAALEWCLDEEDEEEGAQAGLRLSGALWWFWETRGHLSEGRQRCAAALARPGSAAAAQEHTTARAEALRGAGGLAYRQGDYASAQALLEEALAIFREIGDKAGIANSLGNLGIVAREQGDYSSARSLLEEALAIFREIGDKAGIANSLGNLGIVAREQGDYSSARSLLEEALAIFREIGDKAGIANSLGNLGIVAREQGDYSSARSLLEASLALQREIGDKTAIANLLNNLGAVAREQGDYSSARSLHEASLALQREIGDKRGMAVSLVNLGPLACKEHNYAAARSCLADCLTLCLALGEKHLTAYALEGCAGLATAQEQPERATGLYGASDGLRAVIGAPRPPNGREEADRGPCRPARHLGEAAFESAWSAGRALTWEQAIGTRWKRNVHEPRERMPAERDIIKAKARKADTVVIVRAVVPGENGTAGSTLVLTAHGGTVDPARLKIGHIGTCVPMVTEKLASLRGDGGRQGRSRTAGKRAPICALTSEWRAAPGKRWLTNTP